MGGLAGSGALNGVLCLQQVKLSPKIAIVPESITIRWLACGDPDKDDRVDLALQNHKTRLQ